MCMIRIKSWTQTRKNIQEAYPDRTRDFVTHEFSWIVYWQAALVCWKTKCQTLVQVQGLVQSRCTHQSDLPEKESLKRVRSQSSVYEDFILVSVYFS